MRTLFSRTFRLTIFWAPLLILSACDDDRSSSNPPPVAQYTVSANAGAGGAISPGSLTRDSGDTADFTVTADSGFEVDSVSGCGGTLTANTYTTAALSADCSIDATFTAVVSAVPVTGLILDDTGRSIEGVEVFNDDGILARSDSSGAVELLLAGDDAMVIRLRKSGYTAQSVVLRVLDSKATFSSVMKVRALPNRVSADTVIDIIDQYGARVSIAGGSLVDQQGNVVTGDIDISMTSVDVSDSDQLMAFPGDFSGLNAQGEVQPLVMPYGTVEYFLSQNGEELNLAPSATATIEIPTFVTQHLNGDPIVVGQQNQLIWYLNEKTGQWVEEAAGVIVESQDSPTGLSARATISHFSWWNFDVTAGSIGGNGEPSDELNNNSCFAPIVFNNVPTGDVTAAVEFLTVPIDGPSHYGEIFLNGTAESSIRLPAGVDTLIYAQAFFADAPGIHYEARFTFRCQNGNSLVVNFEGPLLPSIQDFDILVAPVFELSGTGQNQVVSNLATAKWTVAGHQSLRLTEFDLPIDILLRLREGSVDIPLGPDSSADDQFEFTLIAQNDEGQVEVLQSASYIAESAPIVDYFSFAYLPGQIVQIRWAVNGADTTNIGYVPNGGADEDLTYIGGQIGLTGDRTDFPFDLVPAGGFGFRIVVEFVNQYGSTYRSFNRGDCPPDTDLC